MLNFKTTYELLQHQCAQRPRAIAAVSRERNHWRTQTWAELARTVDEIALGLLGLDLRARERVAIIAPSTMTWVASSLAVTACGAIQAPILHRLSAADRAQLIELVGCSMALVDSPETAAWLLSHRDLMPHLRRVIAFDTSQAETEHRPHAPGDLVQLAELRQLGASLRDTRGAELAERQGRIEAREAATLWFTAGTTEQIKVVSISHDALMYEIQALDRLAICDANDVVLLCMPLAHAFSQVIASCWLSAGSTLALTDSTGELLDSITYVQPTVLAAPPRVFELLYGTIVRSGQEARGARSRLFAWAMKMAKERMHVERDRTVPRQLGWSVARRAVFDRLEERLRQLFGGRARLFITGGGPLAERIAYFMDYAGITIYPTYGLTESCGISCVNTVGRDKIGTVGPALPGTEIKLAADGEILLRGRGIMLGYWNEPGTGLAVNGAGYLSTGDVGTLDKDGFLSVLGRKEDQIRFPDGRTLMPQMIETALKTNAFIGHALVEATRPGELVALISLDSEILTTWARRRSLPYRDFTSLARSPEVRRVIQEVVDDRNRRLGPTFKIARFTVADRPFAIGSELTASMRLRRHHVRQKFRVALDAMLDRSGEP